MARRWQAGNRNCAAILSNGRNCAHLVGSGTEFCWQHRHASPPMRGPRIVQARAGCQLEQSAANRWRCLTHEPDNEAWQIAEALGARIMCGPLPIPLHEIVDIAASPDIDEDTARILAYDGRDDVFVESGRISPAIALAANPMASANILRFIAHIHRGSPKVVREVVQHPNCPRETLEWAAGLVNTTVRQHIARLPSTPPDIVGRLARDPLTRVATLALANPMCPEEELWRAVEGHSDALLRAVADNPAAPPDVLRRLVSANSSTKYALARNPACPRDVLEVLSRSISRYVRSSAEQGLRRRDDESAL